MDPKDPPDPPWLDELLDAARKVQMSPELEAELDQKVYAAVAEDRRRRAAERSPRPLLRAVLAVACLALFGGGIVLAVHFRRPDPIADHPTPTDHRRSRELPVRGEPDDAGPGSRPEKR
jgi:hypothetical protein